MRIYLNLADFYFRQCSLSEFQTYNDAILINALRFNLTTLVAVIGTTVNVVELSWRCTVRIHFLSLRGDVGVHAAFQD